jgi:hypothetical protein
MHIVLYLLCFQLAAFLRLICNNLSRGPHGIVTAMANHAGTRNNTDQDIYTATFELFNCKN